MEKELLEKISKAQNSEKLDIIDRYFDNVLKCNDLKIITSTIKFCLAQCAVLDIECKNDSRLLMFFIKISKFFKNKSDFFDKLYQQSFFHNSPKFYDAWLTEIDKNSDKNQILRVNKLKYENCRHEENPVKQHEQTHTLNPNEKKQSLLPLYKRLILIKPEVSLEEYLSFLWIQKFYNDEETLKKINNPNCFWDIFSEIYKRYLDDRSKNTPYENTTHDSVTSSEAKLHEGFDDTVNKTLLKVKPLPPDATPTVNTKEARGFIDNLCLKPAFDSSDDDDEDFFTKVIYQRKCDSPHVLHRSLNILDVWKSPSNVNSHTDETITKDKNKEPKQQPQNTFNSHLINDKNNTNATSGYGTLTSGCISIDKPGNPLGSTLIRPFIQTPFAKFKMQIKQKSADCAGPIELEAESNKKKPTTPIEALNDDITLINFQNLQLNMYTSTPSVYKSNS